MISLADMNGVAVDPERATLTAAGRRDVGRAQRRAAGAHGLAVTGGAVSTTGIAGLTLGGGLGWLMAKHGLAADNLLGVELVTAAGEVLEVDASRTRTSSGRCAAAAATSASSPRSPTACTRSAWSPAA